MIMTKTREKKIERLLKEKNAIVKNMRKEHEKVADLMIQIDNLRMED